MSGRYITHPGTGRTFHIFTEEHRSLCGRYVMFRRNPDACDPVKGDETWVKGQDCKACWRKAGLPLEAS